MAIEVKYVGGPKDGQARRTRSLGDLNEIERGAWREFDKRTGEPTGLTRREYYQLDKKRREYVFLPERRSKTREIEAPLAAGGAGSSEWS